MAASYVEKGAAALAVGAPLEVGRAGNQTDTKYCDPKQEPTLNRLKEAKARAAKLADRYIAEDGSAPDLGRLDTIGSLSPADYGRRRADLAEEMEIPLAFLDKEYGERRRRGGSSSERTAERSHWQVEPWPEPVDVDKLVNQIARRLRRHAVVEDETALAVALWIVLSWVHEVAVNSPILLVSSPEAECGKTTLLALVSYLVPRGMVIVEVSSAVLYRMIEKWHPTLIVDEADTAFKNNPTLRSVINSGWTRGAGVPRCHPDTNEPEFFETFGPKAVGLKGLHIPDTTLSRSIVVEMQRKLPEDSAEDFDHTDDAELASLRRQLARFAADNMAGLRSRKATLPEGFSNRLAANWKLMLAIAELCGTNTADRARAAAVYLSRRSDDASLGVEVLRDIRGIFASRGVDRLSSEELVSELTGMADRPWAEMPYTFKTLTQVQLAKLLKPYKVKPYSVRIGDRTPKGYLLAWFDKAFRYIPVSKDPPDRGNTATTADFSQKSRNTSHNGVAAETADFSQCCGVAAEIGGPEDEIATFEERAAIREFDGGFDRAEAEALAAAEFDGWRDLPSGLRRWKGPSQ